MEPGCCWLRADKRFKLEVHSVFTDPSCTAKLQPSYCIYAPPLVCPAHRTCQTQDTPPEIRASCGCSGMQDSTCLLGAHTMPRDYEVHSAAESSLNVRVSVAEAVVRIMVLTIIQILKYHISIMGWRDAS